MNKEKEKKEPEKDSPPDPHQDSALLPSFKARRAKPRPFQPMVDPELPIFITWSIYGKRKSGKSVFLRWLINYYRSYLPWIFAFTKTKQNCFFEGFIPSKFIVEQFSPAILKKIMESQKKALEVHLKNPEFNPRIGVIWDDYNGNDITYNDVLRDYYYTGRHYLSQNYFSAQFITLTPPAVRSNTDVAVLFNTDYRDSLDHYWKDFAGKMDRNEFYDMFVEYCEKVPHGFLMVVTDAPYDKKFYYGVAEVLPIDEDHITCCEEAWRENEKQLAAIKDGTMQEKIDMISELTELGDLPNLKQVDSKRGAREDGVNFRAAWQLPSYNKPLPSKFEPTRVDRTLPGKSSRKGE